MPFAASQKYIDTNVIGVIPLMKILRGSRYSLSRCVPVVRIFFGSNVFPIHRTSWSVIVPRPSRIARIAHGKGQGFLESAANSAERA